HATQRVVLLRLCRVLQLAAHLGDDNRQLQQPDDTEQHGEGTDEDDDLADGAALVPVALTEIRAADQGRQVGAAGRTGRVDTHAGKAAGRRLDGCCRLSVVHWRGRLTWQHA